MADPELARALEHARMEGFRMGQRAATERAVEALQTYRTDHGSPREGFDDAARLVTLAVRGPVPHGVLEP